MTSRPRFHPLLRAAVLLGSVCCSEQFAALGEPANSELRRGRTAGTCEELERLVLDSQRALARCSGEAACSAVLNGLCGQDAVSFATRCYLPVGDESVLADLRDAEDRFSAECRPRVDCDCNAPPIVACVDGRCTLHAPL